MLGSALISETLQLCRLTYCLHDLDSDVQGDRHNVLEDNEARA